MNTEDTFKNWKNYAAAPEFDPTQRSGQQRDLDEIEAIRQKFGRRVLLLGPLSVLYFGYLTYLAILHFFTQGHEWTRLLSASISMLFILLYLAQFYLSYTWRRASLGQDTGSYLRLSRRILLGQIDISKKVLYYVLPMAILAFASVYTRYGWLPASLFAAAIAVGIIGGWSTQQKFISGLEARYHPLVAQIDRTLAELNNAA